jgi:hypothetical protein
MNAVYPRTSSLAVVSLIFGILAWLPPVLPFVGALVAVVCGHAARSEIRRAPPGSIEGDGMALAGLVLGWIQLVLAIIAIAIFLLFIAGVIAFGRWH